MPCAAGSLGGAVLFNKSAPGCTDLPSCLLNITNSTFAQNTASTAGGAVYLVTDSLQVVLDNGTLSHTQHHHVEACAYKLLATAHSCCASEEATQFSATIGLVNQLGCGSMPLMCNFLVTVSKTILLPLAMVEVCMFNSCVLSHLMTANSWKTRVTPLASHFLLL